LLIGGSVIIVTELDEKKDPVISIGQSTTEDLFPEIKKQTGVLNLKAGRICLPEKLSARVHLTYCLRNMGRGIGKLGFYNEEARFHLRLEDMKVRGRQKIS
jgi:hypothetical protein